MKKVLLASVFLLGLLSITPMAQANQVIGSGDNEMDNVTKQYGLAQPTESIPKLSQELILDDSPSSDEPFVIEEYTTTSNQTFPVRHEEPDASFNDANSFQFDHSGDAFLPDMNSTSPERQSADPGFTTDSHTSEPILGPIDHHYIKALPYWTKEGHWFPKTDYSQLRYQVNFGTYLGVANFRAYVKVQSDQDTIPRYLRFYFDGGKVGNDKVIYAGTNEATFEMSIWWGGTHTLTVEIFYGGYKDYGWKLALMEVYSPAWHPPPRGEQSYEDYTWHYRRDLETEFFRKTPYSRLEFDVILGPSSYAYIKIDRHNDEYTRYFWIYVDGVKKNGDDDLTPLSKLFYLGSYTRGSLHKLRLEIYYADYKDYGWKLDLKFKVYYSSLFVEVDYMNATDHNHKPDQVSISNLITDYYRLHGAQNLAFIIDDAITPEITSLSWNQHESLYQNRFDHKGQYGWKYMVVGHYGLSDQIGYVFEDPPDVPNDTMIFIAAQRIADELPYYWLQGVRYEKWMRTVIMHEVGHTVGIGIWNPNEVYCPQPYSVMAFFATPGSATEDYQEYDWEHWSLRSMP